MKKFIIFIAFFSAFVAQAQNSTKREKIKTLFSLMHQDSMMYMMMENMSNNMIKNSAAINNNDQENIRILSDTAYANKKIKRDYITNKYMDKVMKIAANYTISLINKEFVDVYEKYYSEEDIDSYISFYKSKAGQKMLKTLPNITKEVMEMMSANMQNGVLEDIKLEMNKMQTELKLLNRVP